MPFGAIRSFSDPDEYALSVRATRYEVIVTGSGRFSAELARLDLHDLWMQRGTTNLPAIVHAANVRARTIFIFRPEAGPDMVRGSDEMRPGTIFRLADEQSSFQRSSGAASWASMSLPADRVSALSESAGFDLGPPPNCVQHIPPPEPMAKLERLHEAAVSLAREAPEIIANPLASRGLESELVQAVVACLRPVPGTHGNPSLGRHRHSAIMRRFRAVVEGSGDDPLYLSDICSELAVSDRTLRVCCQEQLGMGPIRYLWLRRMQLARRALCVASPSSSTVTGIATSYGFWELGRFAVSYRRLYGELPSATLHRPQTPPLSRAPAAT